MLNLKSKENLLFLLLGCFFIANAVIAEFIGVKIFSVEATAGIQPFSLSLFGFDNLAFNMSAGVLLWPMVFIMTDIINEYYGPKGVRLLSYIGVVLISYAFMMVYFSIHLSPADFWLIKTTPDGDLNMNTAFNSIFGQGLWIIAGSIIAFLVSQLIDVAVFHRIKRMTGDKMIWLRSTGSTVISQLIDSFVVLFIAFYFGGNWTVSQVLAVGLIGYIYKFIVAIAMTPILYIIHNQIDNYLGHDLARKMMDAAANQKD